VSEINDAIFRFMGSGTMNSNIEHRTLNIELRSSFDVQSSTLDVRRSFGSGGHLFLFELLSGHDRLGRVCTLRASVQTRAGVPALQHGQVHGKQLHWPAALCDVITWSWKPWRDAQKHGFCNVFVLADMHGGYLEATMNSNIEHRR